MDDMDNSVTNLIADEYYVRLDTYIQLQDIGLTRSRIKNMIVAGFSKWQPL